MQNQDVLAIKSTGENPEIEHDTLDSAWTSRLISASPPGPPTSNSAYPLIWLHVINYATLTLLTTVLAISISRLLWCHVYRRYWSPIRLETTSAKIDRVPTRKDVLAKTLLDNLDHTLAEDGDPLHLPAFWRSVRLHKVIIAFATAASLAVRVTWLVQYWPTSQPILTLIPSLAIVETLTAAYSLLILTCDLFTDDFRAHAQMMWHLFTLSAISLLRIYFVTFGHALIPGNSARPRSVEREQLIVLGLALILFMASGTIRLGPDVFRERGRLYNRVVTDKVKEVGEPIEANVFGSGDSIIGSFMSISTFKLMRQVAPGDQIDLHELPVVPADMQAEPITIGVRPQLNHKATRLGPTLSLIWVITKPIWVVQVKYFVCMLIELSLAYIPHFCLQQILAILDGGHSRQGAMAYATLWILAWGTETVARMTRNFEYKLLTRNTYYEPAEDDQNKKDVVHSKADIVNLISDDAKQIEDLPYTITRFLRIAIQLAIGCAYIRALLGPSGMWGVVFSFITYPFAFMMAKWEYRVYDSMKVTSDKRVTLIQEALQTITMIKMMASERFWYHRLNDVSQKGFRLGLKARFIGFVSGVLYSVGPILVIVVAFAHYTLIAKEELTASIAFTSIAVFGETRSALTNIPQQITDLMKQLLGAKRVSLFLATPDVEYLNEPDVAVDIAKEDEPLTVMGDVTWSSAGAVETDQAGSSDATFVLRNLDISFERGHITLIAGKYGSGKSLLLQALLGEVTLVRGHISYAVSPILDPWQTEQQIDWTHSLEGLAYVPQAAWLQSLSIRENILFGLPMDTERYKQVIYACALLPDFGVLEDSDLTEIGERGKILSGGQKARVSLARAVYSRASTILLDDVISAVDAQTSQHIVRHCFQSPLMTGRTIIIASHAVESLAPIADKAIFLEDCTVVWQGTGPGLLESEYMAHLQTIASPDRIAKAKDLEGSGSASAAESPAEGPLAKQAEDFELQRAPLKTPRQVLIEENRVKGSVDLKHWTNLMRSNGGKIFFTAYAIFTAINAVLPMVDGLVLKAWTTTAWPLTTLQWVALYSTAALMYVIVRHLTLMYYWYGGYTARNEIYKIIQDRVLRAQMSFFTKTRVGSVVQRLGSDLSYSMICSWYVSDFLFIGIDAMVSLLTLTIFAGWIIPAGIGALVALTWRPTQWYRSSARQVRRLTSTTNGPVNAIYSETVVGAAVIRAFGAQSIFVREMVKTTNMSRTCALFGLFHNRWLSVLSSSGYMLVLGSTLAVIVGTPSMTGGRAGFVLGFAESITHQLVRCMELLRSFETSGVYLERLAEYQDLKTEDIRPLFEDVSSDPAENDQPRLDSWPNSGDISVDNLSARYAPDMPDILHDVSFSCAGGQRVGIVGATGGGKSTLAKALFRFVEISGGTIKVDDEDISGLPLGVLRSRMGIIAQDPILLSGTLRLNLDIEGHYTDDQLNEALRQVQLIGPGESTEHYHSETSSVTVVASQEDQPGKLLEQQPPFNIFTNLDYEIETGGQNLSAGQKQLVVLARALLKRHRILILDEATASIDSKTDSEISRVVHEEFEGTTVLIIAHRLRTIMPCSKILVMDQGRIIQQGSPMELIREDGGKFQSLCKAAGEDEYRHLQSLAESAGADES